MNAASSQTLRRIVVDVEVGKDRMAASDDPVFLGLRGPDGREFRLAHAKGNCESRDPETGVHRTWRHENGPDVDCCGSCGLPMPECQCDGSR